MDRAVFVKDDEKFIDFEGNSIDGSRLDTV
jgi:hypothetical protein